MNDERHKSGESRIWLLVCFPVVWLSVILCLAAGLIMDIRPHIILRRAFISFVISAMLRYALVWVIERYTSSEQHSSESSSNTTPGQEQEEIAVSDQERDA